MPTNLVVRVQVDRLPAVTDPVTGMMLTQVGLRVSALLELGAADVLPRPLNEISHDFRPWEWKSPRLGVSTYWNPHLPEFWRLFRLDRDASGAWLPTEISSGVHKVAIDLDGIDPSLPDAFTAALAKTLELIVKEGGEAAVCLPPEGSPIEHRTVFGMVESLTILPHPIPAGMRVFTVLGIEGDLADARVIAIPSFLPASGGEFDIGAITVDAATVANPDGVISLHATPVMDSPDQPWAEQLKFQIRASLEPAEMGRVHGSSRLLDLTTLTIAKATDDKGDEDYATHLADRLADALDPAARLVSAFDRVLSKARANDGELAALMREDLRRGITNPARSHVLRTLDGMTVGFFQPLARASEAVPAVAVSLFSSLSREQQAGTRTTEAQNAGQMLLRMLDRDDDRSMFMPDRTRYALMPLARLAAALDVDPEEVAPAKEEAPSIDTENGFLRFIRESWFGELASGASKHPLAAGASRVLAAKVLTVDTVDHISTTFEPVLDADVLAEPGLVFQLQMDAMNAVARLHVGSTVLEFERTAVDKISARLTATSVELTVATAAVIVFRIELSGDRSILRVLVDGMRVGLETPALDVARRPFAITLEAVGAVIEDLQPLPADAAFASRVALRVTASSARSNLALAYIGPYIPGILAGRDDWTSPARSPVDQPLANAIGKGTRALADALYVKLYNDANEGLVLPELLDRFLRDVIAAAREDAVRLAIAAVPVGPFERLTMEAPPLVVRIDQFQSFAADAWARVAGYGALLARELPGDEPSGWWSLNAAALYAAPPGQPRSVDEAPFIGIVDPVAIQVGQGSGVRQCLISYHNRWLATGLASDTVVDGQATTARRPEILAPPPRADGYVLPALSFGYEYSVLPYLIGHGGVLPVWLREFEIEPMRRKGDLGKKVLDPLTHGAPFAHDKVYFRSRPIGVPRFVEKPGEPAISAPPENVAPLAAELPIRPAPITLSPDQSAMFFRDASGQRGTLSFELAAEGELAGIRLLIGEVCAAGTNYAANKIAVEELSIALWGTDDQETSLSLLWEITVDDVLNDLRVSLFIGAVANGKLTVHVERQDGDNPDFAEDEGRFTITESAIEGLAPEKWRDMFLIIGVPASAATAAQFEPPVAVEVHRRVSDAPTVASLAAGTPLVAPETSHRSRLIALFDGIDGAKTTSMTLRRPSVEFGTFERWINPAIIETTGAPATRRTDVKEAINTAYELATREPELGTRQRDASFDDPAVTAFCVELVEIFPYRRNIGLRITNTINGPKVFDHSPIADSGDPRQLRIDFEYPKDNSALDAVSVDNVLSVTLQPGHVYELRAYAVVASEKQDFSPFETMARLSDPVASTLRQVSIGRSTVTLGPPAVITIEVATDKLPDLYGKAGWDTDRALVVIDRPPNVREDTARIYLPADLLTNTPEFDPYPSIRYAVSASLYSQRWSWRGRPQAEIDGADSDPRVPNSEWARDLAETAFIDRRDADVGDIIVRRLEKAHVYAGRALFNDPLIGRGTAIFNKPLDWKAGLNLWRFGFSLTSRYAPLFPPRHRPSPEVLAHLPPPGQQAGSAWAVLAVPDRPSGREIARPGLALVLPLTEPLMAAGATPPLLALFNDRIYSNFNIADNIDVAVEVARHPFTPAEQIIRRDEVKDLIDNRDPRGNRDELYELEGLLRDHRAAPTDALKHWQEFGPDPIRTGAAHDGSPILLRVDGPIGYTFDAETEAGRFDHAGLLISPVAQALRSWSMIKLRFRRVEAPEALADEKPIILAPGSQKSVRLFGRAGEGGNDFDAVDYDGLVVDLGEIPDESETIIGLELTGQVIRPAVDIEPNVTVTIKREEGLLTIGAVTVLGEAGTSAIPIARYETAAMRIVLSARERPEGAEKWKPQGDAAIKIKIADKQSGVDVLEQLDRNRWLAVNAVPLSATAAAPADAPLTAIIKYEGSPGTPSIMPVRLSGFTPSVWCQFTESMSVLMGTFVPKAGDEWRGQISIEDLEVESVNTGPRPNVRALKVKARKAQTAVSDPDTMVSLETLVATDVGAQVDQILLAVVTRYVTDAFARLRERPIGILHLTDTENRPMRNDTGLVIELDPSKSEAAWWADDETPPLDHGNGGRLRFLRMLVPRHRGIGGFAETPSRRLEDLFERTPEPDTADLNPSDARGLILGVSRPVEWG